MNSSAFENSEVITSSELRLVFVLLILVIGVLTVFIPGVIGNGSVINAFARNPHIRTVTNIFACNMALADFIALFCCMIPYMIGDMFPEWKLGSFSCRAVPYTYGVTICVSVYSLFALSIERFMTIWLPVVPRLSKKITVIICVIIWLCSLSLSIPSALFFQIIDSNTDHHPGATFCVLVWPQQWKIWGQYYFRVVIFFFCYMIPLGIILTLLGITYIRIIRSKTNAAREQIMVEVKGVSILVLIFILTLLPLYGITLDRKSSGIMFADKYLVYLYPLAQLICHLRAAVNPFVYANRKKIFHDGIELGEWFDKIQEIIAKII